MAQPHNTQYIEKPMTTYGRTQGPSRRYRRLRHPTFPAAEWTAKNPLLQRGEIGAESDTHQAKIGDGVTYWNDLPYISSVGQPLSDADYQMGNAQGGWTTMSQAQQDALNSGATSAKISQIATNTSDITNINNTIAGYGNIVTHNVSEFATAAQGTLADTALQPGDDVSDLNNDAGYQTAGDVATAISGKQDTLTAGTNINITGTTISATDTTYTGSDGITLTGTNFTNSGVRSVASGATNGTISVNTNGTSTDVAVTGLGSAAYTSSSDYATPATTLAGYGITDGANTDLSNLTSTGQNIANWSTNVSNCITYIPQDIKLEFLNGTITLKAGSKVYYPDGTYAIVASDSSITATNADAVAYYNENGVLGWAKKSECYAQPTAPTATQYMLWWDTTNNVMKHTSDNGSTWQTVGLPVCSFIANATQITELSRTFNGFGFMGPLVFMLPGVKMLIPNGKNADGSLKNIEWEADTVYRTNYRNWVSTYGQAVQMGPSRNNIWTRYVQTEYMPATNDYTLWYKPSENILRLNNTANNYTSEDQWTITTGGIYVTNIGPGTNIDPTYYKQPGVCHVLDYQNTEYMCNQATPSGVAINLTPANNTYYTAPADGWFVAIGSGTGTNMWLELTSDIAQGVYGTVGWQYKVSLAVKKGASCQLSFNDINFTTFKFVYANGAIGWK